MAIKVLVTGGAGFVGRRFVRRFLEAGAEVHCVDSLVPFTGGLPPKDWMFDPRDFRGFRFVQEDCRTWFRRAGDDDFDYAVHLAAVVGGRLMIENNPLAVADDLSIDSEYWQWAARAKPMKTVCFSSSAAYPVKYQTRENPTLLCEDMIDFGRDVGLPDYSYGWAKLTNEYLAKLAYEKYGLKSATYRPFSGYGEDQDDTYPFPSICKRVLEHRDKRAISVWGTGDQLRDFIHIDDCVEGVFATMDRIDNGDALNLSTGIYTSFKEFARTAARICGFDPVVTGMSDRPSGVFARGGDITKQVRYGFKYRTGFEDGIRRALEHYASQRHLGYGSLTA
jgi:nucleoside-diphosphate-sugar epimerase